MTAPRLGLGRLEVFRRRGPLERTRRRLKEGALTVGFLGGSITDGRPGFNWPDPVVAALVERFPRARLVMENAAIGATGSDSAAFRARRDVLDRGCDLVFVEYAVNDNGTPTERRRRTREGLLRQLLAPPGRDVVLVHLFCQAMYEDMMAGRVPASIAEFEQLGEHYGLSSVWAGLHALREVQAGRMRWEQWLPDGLHPQDRGSLSYAQGVVQFLEGELGRPHRRPSALRALPPPLDPLNWQSVRLLPLSRVALAGPWTLRRHLGSAWIDQVLETAAVAARCSFAFRGRVLTLGLDFGKTSADFRWRLDGGAWRDVPLDRPDWCGDTGWYRWVPLADDLSAGGHRAEIEVVRGTDPNCRGTNFRLAAIGVVR